VTSLSSSREACPAKTDPSPLFPKSSMKTKFATGIYNTNERKRFVSRTSNPPFTRISKVKD